ncbi:hypothetical protein HMPREF0201_00586 [Cedecea davisae DSM 4568]|uniref:Uncharacterized protein n=1 Tax=Cedecea davisae DSM 4568 TaxID=566551 RepID=S3J857_9ENTR|nr:hypothetical protein HMPREF0201_00586 [Cedecea davisae DSM 4568]
MLEPQIANVQQPVVDQAKLRVFYRSLYAAAAVMAANNDVLNLKDVYRVLNNREAVQIGMDHQVGDITMYKQLARFEAGKAFRRDAAIGAADPEETGFLCLGESFEETRVFLNQHFGPKFIIADKGINIFHVRLTPVTREVR